MANTSAAWVEDGRRDETSFSQTANNSQESEKQSRQENSRTFLKISGGLSVVGIIVLVVILPIYFEVIAPNGKKEDQVFPEENERFDCFPEGEATKETCELRGCMWLETTSGSPSCFYASNDGYTLNNQDDTATGYRLRLERSGSDIEPYGTEFRSLIVEITRMTRESLRIKIRPDGGEARFEVPWVHDDPAEVSEEDALYEVDFPKTPDGVVGIRVKRKITGTIIFDTAVGKMIFADQFLQISTRLPSTYVYGFGEHMHETFKHDMNWKSYGMFSRDQGVGPNVNLYGVHPYYTCMEGDGNAHGVLFLNSNAQDVTFQPSPALTYRTVGGLFDFHIFLGPHPEQVTSQYTNMIGRPYMPPFWALGFQLCRYGYGSLDNLKTVVDRMLATEMPYDVQYTDIDYMDRQLDFTINATTYAGLEDYARELKSVHQMRYFIILDPAISGNETAGTYPPFELGVRDEVFITDADGEIAWGKVWPDIPNTYINLTWDWESQTEAFRAYTAFPDFFKTETKDWWRNQTVVFHKRLEFDGLWIDMNEPASFVHGTPSGTCPSSKWDDPLPYHPNIAGDKLYDKTTCMGNLQHHTITGQPERHYNMHSLYGWSQSEPTLDACRASTGERCMVISRSTFPGSGKFVGHWLGDNTSLWSHLAASIIGMLEFNLFGIPYIGADICGFFQDTTEELCMRWMQLGAFYPFNRNHNGLGFKDQDPAVFGPDFAAASKKILEVRYSILPYFYTLFFDSHTTGSTVVRSLMAEFPMDLNTYTVDKQMLLGGELLISPVLEPGATSVEAYVPDARWYDFYTGMELASELRETKTNFDAPWDHIPLHVRGGSILAMQTPARTTAIQRSNGLGVLYALSDSSEAATGHLFWDDGNSINTVEEGLYVLINFEGTKDNLSAKIQHSNYSDADSMIFDHIVIMGVASEQILRVTVNSVTHSEFTYNPNSKVLNITGLQIKLTSEWILTWDDSQYADRFDCQPETFKEVTESTCQSRECLWDPVSSPGVPACYYPPNYGAYRKNNIITVTEKGEEFSLTRQNRPVFFADPVETLKVEVEMQSDHQLRIKIFDPSVSRYEVPLEVSGAEAEKASNPLYEVEYQDEPFSFKIIRKSTGEIIMDTSVGAMIFEDQFLQISTKVSTTHTYGLGEAEHPNYKLNFDWTTQALHARGEPVQQNANLYGHHPYLLSMERNGDAHGILFLNSNAMEVSLTPLPSITYRTIGGILDFYLFMGPTPEQVVQQYTSAVSLPMMPPYWALGFQLCKYDYENLDGLKTVVEEMRDYNIPYDVQYGDIDYMDRQLDFTIDPVNYVGLSDYVDKMRNEYNMRYVIILDPAISSEESDPYPPYTEGEDADVFIKTSDGEVMFGNVWPYIPRVSETNAKVAFPDFFYPNTSDWWRDQVVTFYNNKLKFDGLWIDMNEPENFIDGQLNNGGCPTGNKYDHPPYLPSIQGKSIFDKTVCMSSMHKHADEAAAEYRHYDVHNLYGWSQAEPTMRACREATGKRCYVISRSTYPGAGKYTGHWFGDNTSKWSHLHSSIIQMFEFGLFGLNYVGADICGFFEDAEEEMCLRWSQLGAFYPFSRNHAMKGVRRQDPAAWGQDFADAVKEVLLKRYSLLPYLYTLFYHSHTSGSSVVRPLMNEFTSDKLTWGLDRQFLWGPALLVSPVLEAGKTAVEAYIPDARWFDMYGSNAEVEARGETVTLSAPKEHINLHIRGGYILPTQDPATTTFESRGNDFGLMVALDDSGIASGDLFWDDGDSSTSISNQDYFYSKFSCEGNILTNHIVHDGYENSSSMILGHVTIIGLSDDVTQVFLGDISNSSKISFTQDQDTKTLVVNVRQSLNKDFEVKWEFNNEWSRFDCMPDLLEEKPDPVQCENRGCLVVNSSSANVPWCIYPDPAIHGYNVTKEDTNGQNDSYTLERLPSPTMYKDDISTIQLNVEYQTNKRLHFKFFDPANSRWEIPESARVLNIPNTIQSNQTAAQYEVEVGSSPASIKVLRKDNREIMFDSSVGALQFADQFLQISTKLPSSNVFGFGEHNHRRYRHDLNWRRWAMFTRDVAPVDDWNLYGMQTFFMAMMQSGDGKCFGLYLHNSNAMDVLLQPLPAVTYRVTGGVLDFYLFVGDSPEDVVREYHHLIGFPTMPPYWALGFQLSRWDYGSLDRVKEVVDEMRSAEIPFDVQYGDIDYMDAKKSFTYDPVLYNGLPEFVDQLHDWGMRYIIILDPGIKIEDGYRAYNDGISMDIFIKNPEGESLVTEVWPGDTHHPDFTNPDSLSWWLNECKDFYHTAGVHYDALWIQGSDVFVKSRQTTYSGRSRMERTMQDCVVNSLFVHAAEASNPDLYILKWWKRLITDMNEPSNFQTDDPIKLQLMNCTGPYNLPPYKPRTLGYNIGLHDKTFCMDNEQYLGLHYNVHSLYGHTMSHVTHDTLQDVFPNERSAVLTRSTFAGTGKFAQHWLGDNQSQWPQMGWAIPAMFEFNLFGFPYIGADVCGFWYNTTAEMCQRWMQVGSFYPFSRNHNGATMIPQHPTAFGPAVAESSRKALNIRYSILPYMYTLFHDVHNNGGTLVRALVHEFFTDPNTLNQDRQFLLGPAFLVTPVLEEGAKDVTAYFPGQSRWFDFYTGEEVHNVGKFISLSAPLDHINLHIRGGYVLPMQVPNVTTTLARTQPMSLLVALDSNFEASGELYWDDGVARNVNQNYSLHHFSCNATRLEIAKTHLPDQLPEEANLYFEEITVYGLDAAPRDVIINNTSKPFTYNTTTYVLVVSDLHISFSGNNTLVEWLF